MTSTLSSDEVVAVQDVGKSYGAVRAVDGVDVTIRRGETVALLGPNGAGKSTLLDMLLGLARPDAGSVALFGGDPAAATTRGRCAAMLQSGGLPTDVTVRELVQLAADLYPAPAPVDTVLEQAGVADLARRRSDKLSGGQTQRVRLALALVADPELVVLDEPTVGLDIDARRAFWSHMRRLSDEGRTILFATHYLAEADDVADRIVLMAHGRVVADDTTSAVKATVAGRTIRATIPGADPDVLQALPGVVAVTCRGPLAELRCSDSDLALRAVLATFPQARAIEVTGADLEDAVLALTAGTSAGASR